MLPFSIRRASTTAPARLHREWERLRKLAGFPLFRRFERFDGTRLIEMEHRIELAGQPRPEIVALPLGFGTVDHTDRPLEPSDAQLLRQPIAVVDDKQETITSRGMEQGLVATGQRRANTFALGRFGDAGGQSKSAEGIPCDCAICPRQRQQPAQSAQSLCRSLAQRGEAGNPVG